MKCNVCNRILKDPASIKLGTGPECLRKMKSKYDMNDICTFIEVDKCWYVITPSTHNRASFQIIKLQQVAESATLCIPIYYGTKKGSIKRMKKLKEYYGE